MNQGRRQGCTKYTKELKELCSDKTLAPSMIASMLDIPKRLVQDCRREIWAKTPEANREAVRRYRERHKEEIKGTQERTGAYWTKEEKEYIMTSTDRDIDQVKKLGRTLSAIQKMRERLKRQAEIEERRKKEEEKKAKQEK